MCPEDASDPSELLRRADAALYKSKQQGGFAFFTAEMEREARERDLLHRELAASIAAGTIVPHYQPIVHLDSGEIRAFEALARWMHPQLGTVPPDRFIPVAEDSGLIKDLSDLLLRQACSDAVQWPYSAGLSFNVSPVLLRDAGFPLRVMTILAETGLTPDRLELEITENAIVKDLDAAKETLGLLRDAGVRIALDDFGTGATSLFHLRSFKFDVIKIDRSFVHLMATEHESAQIVKAVLGLAHGLDVQIIAEGVEDQGQRTLLQAQGCQEGQGYLFSQAVAAADVPALLSGTVNRQVG